MLQLNYIVTNNYVDGWDDPRLLTLAGLRRRGVSPTAINAFVRGIGITRRFAIYIYEFTFILFGICRLSLLICYQLFYVEVMVA